MLRIGKLADYGLLIADCLARERAQLTTNAIVDETGLPEATVRKLLKLLVDAGLVSSRRGVHGGYRLARTADRITVAELIAAIEGPISLTECAQDDSTCTLTASCGQRGNWHVINDLIHQQLATITLADMTGDLRRGGSRIPVLSVAS
ncbi:MAG: SUF system Fe-S cluster assembly regulator [Spongiibacteraceae bacterium]|jgi:FeS assembly SUF system regulator|nr:SUF system Fe-S cluster assembly regulator [Spongiibacteraceae bacterium]